MLILSIPSLLHTLLDLLIVIIEIALIYTIAWLAGRLFRWLWRSLIIPIFQRRAYFYAFKEDDEGFYVEKPLRILFFIRLRRNKRWALQKDLVGYVAKRTGGDDTDAGGNAAQAENDIFFTSFLHKTHVGQVKSPAEETMPGGGTMRKCEVILKRSNIEGDQYYDTPVGFINEKGEIYKYYEDRNAAIKGKKLKEPVLIGYARSPQLQERKKFPGSYDTDAEAAIEGIEDTNEELNEWFFFRKRKRGNVKSQKIVSSATNKGHLSLWTAGWRVLHAHLVDGNPDRKMTPWGVGYAVEDFWRNLFTKDAFGFSLDARAVAALLLAEKEGFYLRDGEQGAEGKKGLWPTALLSFVCYLCAFPSLNRWEGWRNWCGKLIDLVGPEISKVIVLILSFFGIWLVVHLIRMLFYDATDRFESLLHKMNNNVGTSNWNTELIIVSAIGLILSIFVVDYLFFPIFFCALVVFIGQRVVFPPFSWDVEYPLSDSDNLPDEEQEENDEEGDERIDHEATVKTLGNSHQLKFSIPYQKDRLKELRAENPFRNGNTPDYAPRIREMIEREYGDKVYSRIRLVKDKIDRFVSKHNLSYLEKIDLILRIAQPDNIKYEYDWNCDEILPLPDEPQPSESLLRDREEEGKKLDGKGYIEYCRYPSETLHDKRGDCDCHAALAVGLLAACGIRCCFFTNFTDDDKGHAALGIEVNDELKKLVNSDNYFTHDKKTFIYAEATGEGCRIGDVPPGFANMLNDENRGTYAVIEPAVFKELSHEE